MDDERLVTWIGDGFPRPIQALVDRIVPGCEPTVGAEQGWWPLLVRLDAQLSAIDPDYRVRRITVADGQLCFELDDPDRPAELDAVISAAVAESARTCEICGNPGTSQRAAGSFYSVLCEDDSSEETER